MKSVYRANVCIWREVYIYGLHIITKTGDSL